RLWSRSSACGGVGVAFFFFQAEDGIRDWSVTGVQTCALPISASASSAHDQRRRAGRSAADETPWSEEADAAPDPQPGPAESADQIGRASCRERVESSGVA